MPNVQLQAYHSGNLSGPSHVSLLHPLSHEQRASPDLAPPAQLTLRSEQEGSALAADPTRCAAPTRGSEKMPAPEQVPARQRPPNH
eukprot:4760706-Pleurochrysis_carterae.AAC.1